MIESYDADGNTTATGGKSFAYDSEDRLKSMNGGAVTITYDGDGNRDQKTANGVITRYLVDDMNPTGYPQAVEETGSAPAPTPTASRESTRTRSSTESRRRASTATTVWATCRQLTNSTGAITDTYEYDAFGNKIASTGTPNNYLYRGEQWDPDLSLYYLRARYYNPLTGRFMSRDPNDGSTILPSSLHKYIYAAGDPINRIDPLGREDLFAYAIRSNAAFTETKLIDIDGCVADASLAAVDLIINPKITTSSALGGSAAVIGCVTLTPGLSDLVEQGNKIVKFVKLVGISADWGACATDVQDYVNGLNDILSGTPDGVQITDSITALGGCVNNALGFLLTHPGATLQGLGL